MGGMSKNLLEMPTGYRFVPTDEELVKYYLANKVMYRSLPAEIIQEIDAGELYSKHPKCLVKEDAYHCDEGEREWYFFIYEDDYFLGEIRTSLMVGSGIGFWRFIGEEVPICNSDGDVFGFKIYLTYFSGTLPNAKKTHWRMEKYRLSTETIAEKHQKVDEWTLGRIVRGRRYNNDTL